MSGKNLKSTKFSWLEIIFIILILLIVLYSLKDFIFRSNPITNCLCKDILEEKNEIQEKYDNCDKEKQILRTILDETIKYCG